jgi:hypothetical protein
LIEPLALAALSFIAVDTWSQVKVQELADR